MPNLFSQKINLNGKIIDELSEQELPNASIIIGNRYFLANNKGLFSINIEQDFLIQNRFSVSYIGHETKIIKNISPNTFILIKLIRVSNQLPEVDITVSAKKIIELAIANISINYSKNPFNLTAFQRTYETVNNTDFYSKNDALIKLYVPGYLGKKAMQTEVFQNRGCVKRIDSAKNKINKIPHPNWLGVYTMGGRTDIVFNQAIFLSNKSVDGYNFSLKGIKDYDNFKAYCIEFSAKEGLVGCEGTIFIETTGYAIIGIAYYFNELAKIKAAEENGAIDFFCFTQVNYKNINHKWYLHYFHTEQYAHQIKPFTNRHYLYKSIVDFVTTSVDTINVSEIEPIERIKKNKTVAEIAKEVSANKWKQTDSLFKVDEFAKFITNNPLSEKN